MDRDLPTAPIAAAGLIAGYGVAVASGSRPLGGLVLAACGFACVAIWLRRDGRRTAALLTGVGLFAFAFSHVLALAIGAWPAGVGGRGSWAGSWPEALNRWLEKKGGPGACGSRDQSGRP